jgi:hypothetical protein
MAKSSGAGGGPNSRQVVHPGVRTGQPAVGRGIGRVAQIGNKVGDHTTENGKGTGYRGDPMFMKAPAGGAQVLGNAKALDVGKGGPGTGRTVMATGSQGQHGAANPGERNMPSGPDPLSPWFGSNNSARRSPVKR